MARDDVQARVQTRLDRNNRRRSHGNTFYSCIRSNHGGEIGIGCGQSGRLIRSASSVDITIPKHVGILRNRILGTHQEEVLRDPHAETKLVEIQRRLDLRRTLLHLKDPIVIPIPIIVLTPLVNVHGPSIRPETVIQRSTHDQPVLEQPHTPPEMIVVLPVHRTNPGLPSPHAPHVLPKDVHGPSVHDYAAGVVRERSHGDGIVVNVDAPSELIAGPASAVRCEFPFDSPHRIHALVDVDAPAPILIPHGADHGPASVDGHAESEIVPGLPVRRHELLGEDPLSPTRWRFRQRENVSRSRILPVGIVAVRSHDGHPVVNRDGDSESLVLSQPLWRHEFRAFHPLHAPTSAGGTTLVNVRGPGIDHPLPIVFLRADQDVVVGYGDGPSEVVAGKTVGGPEDGAFLEEGSFGGRITVDCRGS
mmetsp:Transcript_32221/g.67543  ORF Transcript_32221/g.67543 Transcript_32221/m.67543 type:complete len:420 (-) Transcript_32221:146-1405(-)